MKADRQANEQTIYRVSPKYRLLREMVAEPERVDRLIARLPPANGAYLVGGAVRDLLLNRTPADFDIAVPSDPESYAVHIARRDGATLVKMGQNAPVIFRVVMKDMIIDVSRIEGASIVEDLRRRDFTVNAMAVSVEDGTLIDMAAGRADLAEGVIRMVSPEIFVDDPVRLLRTFRLACQFDFSVDPTTLDAVERHADRIVFPAAERIHAEWVKLLAAPGAVHYVRKMANRRLLFALFPELGCLKGCEQNRYHQFDALEHTLIALEKLETILARPDIPFKGVASEVISAMDDSVTPTLKWAVLLHDLGKADTRTVDEKGNIHFYGHEHAGAEKVLAIAERMKCSAAEARWLEFLVRHHLRPLKLFAAHGRGELTRRGIIRFFMKCGAFTPALLLHSMADNMAKRDRGGERELEIQAFIAHLMAEYFKDFLVQRRRERLISGHDLMRTFHLEPSPLLGKILEKVEEARLNRPKMTRADAFEMVRDILDSAADNGGHNGEQ